MQSPHSRTICFLTAMVLAAACLGGCTKEMTVYQVPAFWQPGQFESVAVVPFRSEVPGNPHAGNAIADSLATALTANGTYPKVYNRRDLAALLTEQDLQELAGGAGDNTALQRLTDVQVIITGTVTQCGTSTRSENRQDPVYAYTNQGVQYVAGYKRYVFTRNEAVVAATATMMSTKTGAPIHASSPAISQQWAQGSPPEYNQAACLTSAMNNVVYDLLTEFAIVAKTIEVEVDKAFRITTGEVYDGQWTDKKAFTTADTEMTVVIALPYEADRNNFRLAVIRKGTKKDLFELPFTWSSGNPASGAPFLFNPQAIAAAGGGPGTYTLKFYAGETPVMERDFYISQAP